MATVSDPASRLIATRIRTARLARSWTLLEMSARMTGDVVLSGALLGRIENCTRPASIPELDAIALALETTISDLTRFGEVCDTCGQEIPS